jgi:acyl carrier protein
MISRENVTEMLKNAIKSFNDSTDNSYNLKFDESLVLFGRKGKLDSIGLVNFVVAIEEEIESTTGETIVLGDDIALSQDDNPFQSISTLIDYIVNKLKD